jgi:signal transduction histidine kinase
MLPEVLERAFEPFFSTKAADFCTGIGLTLAHTIARKHLGCVALESVHGQGTTARIYLPAIKE